MTQYTTRDDDLKLARRLHVTAMQSGSANDYIIAAELFEKCGRYDDAKVCREASAACEWTAEEILRREG